jgi:hypothetical protein
MQANHSLENGNNLKTQVQPNAIRGFSKPCAGFPLRTLTANAFGCRQKLNAGISNR